MINYHLPLYIFLFFLTLIITILVERKIIPILREFAKQPIYAEGPKWHSAKYGTPTMGGLAFLCAAAVSLGLGFIFLLRFDESSKFSLLFTLGFAIANALVGIIDDRAKLKKKRNKGLTPIQKLILQTVIGVSFLALRSMFVENATDISFSFGKINLGIWYYPISLIIILLVVNSANLTDGIDGLASSVAFGIGMSLLYISSFSNPSTAITASVLLGASLAFLLFNIHPAKIFMGDTGSLFIGALVAASGFSLGNPILIMPISGVFVIEGASVIIQVLVYKLTKKRVFKMAPLHHHFEKSGWSENRICLVAILATLILSFPAFLFYGY